jgi:hypothetical protein
MLRTWLALVHLKLRTSPWRRKGHVSSLQRRKRLSPEGPGVQAETEKPVKVKAR